MLELQVFGLGGIFSGLPSDVIEDGCVLLSPSSSPEGIAALNMTQMSGDVIGTVSGEVGAYVLNTDSPSISQADKAILEDLGVGSVSGPAVPPVIPEP